MEGSRDPTEELPAAPSDGTSVAARELGEAIVEKNQWAVATRRTATILSTGVVVIALALIFGVLRHIDDTRQEARQETACALKLDADWKIAITAVVKDHALPGLVTPAQMKTDLANLDYATDRLDRVDAICLT